MVETLAPSKILQSHVVIEIIVKARKTPTRLVPVLPQRHSLPNNAVGSSLSTQNISPEPNSEGESSIYESRTKLLVPIAPYCLLLPFTFPDCLSHHLVCILEIPIIHRTADYPVIDANANVYIIVCTKVSEKCSYPWLIFMYAWILFPLSVCVIKYSIFINFYAVLVRLY